MRYFSGTFLVHVQRLHHGVSCTSARTEWVDNFCLWKGAVVFGGLEGVSLSLSLGLRLAWSGGAAEIKG